MSAQQLITEHLDIWSSAVKAKSAAGRGKSNKIELYGIKKLRELILELAANGLLVETDLDGADAYKKVGDIAGLVMGQAPPGSECNKAGDGTIFVKTGEFGPLYPEVIEWTTKPLKFAKKGDVLICVVGATVGKLNLGIDCAIGRSVAAIRPKEGVETKFLYYSLMPFTIKIRAKSKGSAQGVIGKAVLNAVELRIPQPEEQTRIVAKVDELMALCDQLEQQQESSISAHQTLVKTLLDALTSASEREGFTAAWARIADHFDTLFTTEHSIDQLKQCILQLAVMGKLVPQDPNDEPASELLKKIAAEKARLVKEGKIKKQKSLPPITDEEKPFELPEGWVWCRMPDIGELARGKSKHRPRNAMILYEGGDIPLVQTGDVSRANGIVETYTALYNQTGLAQSRLWPKGTMCITIAANIADTAVLGFDACFPDSVVGFVPFDEQVNVRYFDFFIRTAKNHLEEYAPSTAQKNINLEILGELLVPCPPLEELKRIVLKADELMSLCDQLKACQTEAQATQLLLVDAVTESAVN